MKKIFLFALPLVAILNQSCKKSNKDRAPEPTPVVTPAPTPTPVTAVVGLKIGNIAPDFTLSNPEGKKFTLSSFRGKTILLDFWAAWCKPCRKENPHLVKLYQRFKNKNFDIVSVSTDYDEYAWKNAINTDGLIWTNLSYHSGDDSQVVFDYKIQYLPTTYLLDKDGKIIANELWGKELEAKLEEVLK